jgi:hypothetical protein
MRLSSAASATPSVSAGSTRLDQSSRPSTGSQSSQMAKTSTSIGPSQKPGSATPSTAKALARRSGQRPWCTAASTPKGKATASATASAPSISSPVAG